mmetsp:Transcript_16851/g.23653  ORF Transcript_16851/g.23653 Transcript_16851/m.23653 type:complete len:360 (-) Transcript_16851:74-1153(-)
MQAALHSGEQEITFEVLASLFHLPLSMAAQQLGVCCTALKKKCRKNGISRWPYRTLQSIDKMIKAIETSPQNERANIELEYLQSKRDVIMRKPNFAAKSPPRPKVSLDVKKTIAKPSAYAARATRTLSPSNPLDVLQEAAKYADASGGRRLAPATQQYTAEPRLYSPQQARPLAQQQPIPQPQVYAPNQDQAGTYANGYYLQPVAASYSASQTYAQAGHQVSMHQSVTARMPQGIQPAPQVRLSPQQRRSAQQQQQPQPVRFVPQQPLQQQAPAKPLSFTFHSSRPSAPVRPAPEKAVLKPRPPSPPQQQQQPSAWQFELPKLRLPEEAGSGTTLPKLRTLEPSAFGLLRGSTVETTMA